MGSGIEAAKIYITTETNAPQTEQDLNTLSQTVDQTIASTNGLGTAQKKQAGETEELGQKTGGLQEIFANANQGISAFVQGLTGMDLETLGVLGGVVALGKGLADSIQAASEKEQADLRVTAALKSTGNAAGLTTTQVKSMSKELSDMSGTEETTVEKNAALMLSFTNIKSDTFPGAMTAAMNLSAALGQDLQSSVEQVGKALNDPTEGLTYLKRAGVTFTDTQTTMIQKFMDTNDVADAQKVILGQLDTQFGGMAKAMGDSYAGKVDKLKNSFHDLEENIGGPLIDVLGDAVQATNTLITVSGKITDAYDAHKTSVLETSATYKDYQDEVIRSAEAAGYATQVQMTQFGQTTTVTEQLTEKIGLLSEAQWAQAKYVQEVTEAEKENNNTSKIYHDHQVSALEAAQAAAGANADLNASFETLGAQEQALSLFMSGPLGKENDDYKQKMSDLTGQADDLNTKIGALKKQTWLTSDQKSQLEDLQTQLGKVNDQITQEGTDHDKATKKILFNILSQQLALDGLSQKDLDVEMSIAKDWGLIDQSTYDAYQEMEQYTGSVDDANASVGSLVDLIENRFNDKTVTLTVDIQYAGGVMDYSYYDDKYGKLPGYATGGSFTVPDGYPNDRYATAMALTSGERVSIERASALPDEENNTGSPIIFEAGAIQVNAQSDLDITRLAQKIATEIRRRKL